jgi:hypothetical protein
VLTHAVVFGLVYTGLRTVPCNGTLLSL